MLNATERSFERNDTERIASAVSVTVGCNCVMKLSVIDAAVTNDGWTKSHTTLNN